jgi:hypothetical protein
MVRTQKTPAGLHASLAPSAATGGALRSSGHEPHRKPVGRVFELDNATAGSPDPGLVDSLAYVEAFAVLARLFLLR